MPAGLILGFDDSAASRQALTVATDLAQRLGEPLHVAFAAQRQLRVLFGPPLGEQRIFLGKVAGKLVDREAVGRMQASLHPQAGHHVPGTVRPLAPP